VPQRSAYWFTEPDAEQTVRCATNTAGRRRGALALLAVLSLWLQIFIPVVGGSARLLILTDRHVSSHGTYEHHGEDHSPGLPAEEHDHLGLCCILGGKSGTGFAPPPSDGHLIPTFPIGAGTVVYHTNAAAEVQDRRVLPLGARAPPQFD
jgi:hypothetical protein